MAEPATEASHGEDSQTIGDLVALTVRDLTRLVHYELDLAKLELRADARRLGLAAAMLGMAAFAGFLVLVLLSFALAYGLMTAGMWNWAAFLVAAGVCVVLVAIAMGVVALKMRRMSGLRRTRSAVQSDLAMLRRTDSAAAPVATKAG